MTPSESDRTVTAEGNGEAAGAVVRRAGEVDQSPWSAVGSASLRAVIWRRGSGLFRNGQAMKPLALAGPFSGRRHSTERWLRGRKHRTRNAAYLYRYRGFESHPLRHVYFGLRRRRNWRTLRDFEISVTGPPLRIDE